MKKIGRVTKNFIYIFLMACVLWCMVIWMTGMQNTIQDLKKLHNAPVDRQEYATGIKLLMYEIRKSKGHKHDYTTGLPLYLRDARYW